MKHASTAQLHTIAATDAKSMEYLKDLEKEIWDALGDLKEIDFWGQEVLCATFARPAWSPQGSIIVPDTAPIRAEDKWQGVAMMVIKNGLQVDALCKKEGLPIPKVGQWVFGVAREQETLSVCGRGSKMREPVVKHMPYRNWKGWPCRLVMAGDIRGSSPRPWEIA